MMEEQKRKYLLNKIAKEQQLLDHSFDQYRKLFQQKWKDHNNQRGYLSDIEHQWTLNTHFCLNLFEFLTKQQVQKNIEHLTVIFTDLVTNYRSLFCSWKKQISKQLVIQKEICDICRESINSNKIQNLKQILQDQEESRGNIIKKIIEESEKERLFPCFTNKEDELFRIQLQKVMKNKENVIGIRISQFQTILKMLDKQIINLGNTLNQIKVENEGEEEGSLNWGKMMKNLIGKKLTGGFHDKMPKWIKKMFQIFLSQLPKEQKIQKCNKQIQTIANHRERHDMARIQEKVEEKEKKISQLNVQISRFNIYTEGLKKQIKDLQKYYEDKIKQINFKNKATQKKLKYQNENENNLAIIQSVKNTDQKQNHVQRLSQKYSRQKLNADSEIVKRKPKRKIGYILNKDISKSIHFPKINRVNSIEGLEQSITDNDKEVTFKLIQSNKNLKKPYSLHSSSFQSLNGNDKIKVKNNGAKEGEKTLKKKVYRNQNRSEILQQSNISELYNFNRNKSVISQVSELAQISINELKDQVKSVNNQLIAKVQQSIIGSQRFNSISSNIDFDSKQRQLLIKKLKKRNKSLPREKEIKEYQQMQVQTSEIFQDQIQDKQKISGIDEYTMVQPEDFHVQNSKLSKCMTLLKNKEQILKVIDAGHLTKLIDKVLLDLCQSHNYHNIIQSLNRFNKNSKAKGNLSHRHQNSIGDQNETDFLDQNSLQLFINEKIALKYEQSLTKSSHKKQSVHVSQEQMSKIQSIYCLIEMIKSYESAKYTNICCLFRFPYTSIKSGLKSIDVVKDMSLLTFRECFVRLMWFHKNCKLEGDFCIHIEHFVERIIEVVSKYSH